MNRRGFLLSAAAGMAMASLPARAAEEQKAEQARAAPAETKKYTEWLNVFGPRAGYSPQIGLLVSMMNWMRAPVLRSAGGLTTAQLDFLLDEHANSIGAMLLHLAATERYYQLNTFENMKWGSWSRKIKDQWDVAMNLGEPARKSIKGHELKHYVDALAEVREHTLSELRKRDDTWSHLCVLCDRDARSAAASDPRRAKSA